MPLKNRVHFISEHGEVVEIRVSYIEGALEFLRDEYLPKAERPRQDLDYLYVSDCGDELPVGNQIVFLDIIIAIATVRRVHAARMITIILLFVLTIYLLASLALNLADDPMEVTLSLLISDHVVQAVAVEVDARALLCEYTFDPLQHIENVIGHHAAIFIIVAQLE